ncbi:MAG: hypothetical protein ABR576_15730 [Thermoanaerobaculia bacterium]
MATDAELIELIPSWLAVSRDRAVRTGLGRAEAIQQAERLLHQVTAERTGYHAVAGDDLKDVLYALMHVVLPGRQRRLDIAVLNKVYTWVAVPGLLAGDEEMRQLLRGLADMGWTACGLDPETLRSLRKQTGDAYQADVRLTFPLGSLGNFFNYCATVARDLERAPARATRRALEGLEGLYKEPAGMFDEREYFKAELSWMAGVAARFRGKLDDASHWFNQAEGFFLNTVYPDFGLAKIAFSRLAILYLNYQFDDVVRESQNVRAILNRFAMPVWAAKCQHVEAMAEKIRGRSDRAVDLLRPLLNDDSVQERPVLRVRVLTQLADSLVELSRHEEAAGFLRSAAQMLEGTEPTASSADFWTILGGFLSVQTMHPEALRAFRRAKGQYVSMDMLWLAAYVAVLISEVALLLDLPSEAASELRWALPILRKEGRTPEGRAAAALLEKSLKQKDLDTFSLRAFRETFQRRNPFQS